MENDRTPVDVGGLGRRSFLTRGALLAGGAAALAPMAGIRPAGAVTNAAGAGNGGVAAAVVTTMTGAAIQTAINALPATGGAVQLVAGTYTVGKPINLRTGCVLVGAGRGATVLQLTSGTNTTVLRNVDTVNGNPGVAVLDLTIDGNRAHQGNRGSSQGIELHRCANFVLENLEVMGCDGTGIIVSGNGTPTRVGSVVNVFSHDNAVHGIWITYATREVSYAAVTCDLNGQDGLVIDHSEAIANGLHCSRNGRDGVRVTNVIANNLVGILADLNGRNGIHVLGFVNSVGSAWAAHNNGLHEAAPDVYFDGTLNTYGATDHSIVQGIECGAAQKSTWGAGYPATPTATETYGLTVDPTIQGNLTLLGVRNCGGSAGTYSIAPPGSTGSVVIIDHAVGTNDLRLLWGDLRIAGGTLLHDSGGMLGFYGAAPTAQPTVSGDKTADPTSVLTSLLGALSALGLVADTTT